MEEKIKNIYLVLGVTAILGIVIFKPTETQVVNRYIQQAPDQITKVKLPDGWECDEPKMTTDLLQPSGYWIGDNIRCWKLQTPIKEYKIQECKRTGDTYWCKD